MAKVLKAVGVIGTIVSFIPGLGGLGTALKIAGAVSYMAGTYIETKQAAKQNSLDTTNFTYASPTYKFGVLQTQVNNTLVRPMIYGRVKAAGNMVWHSGGDSETIKKIICYGDGPINGFSDVKFNEIPYAELTGCSYDAYLGTGTQGIDARVPGSSESQRAAVCGGLKYDAYLAVTATASDRLNDSYFDVSAIVEGRLVRVYTTTTAYTTVYSNNPAWCILDFLTAYNGCREDIANIDIQSFIDAAAYCDALVDGQKRFSLNLICDCRKRILDWLNEMLICCRGYLVYQDGKLFLQIEQAGESVQSFDEDNIIFGTEKFWTTGSNDRYDIVKVRYIDPENEYARIFAVAEADEITNPNPVVHELEAFGITNFKQASRLAWFYLNQSRSCNKLVSFTTTKEGLDRTVGDIIDITSTFLGYSNKLMRIIKMSEAQEGQIEIYCKEYNEGLYADTQGSVEPVIDVITLPNLFDIPPSISGLALTEIGWGNRDGVHIANLDLAWNAPAGTLLYKYLVTYSTDGGTTWKTAGVAQDTEFRIENVKTGDTYQVGVQAMNNGGVLSAKVTLPGYTVVGKDEPPDDVTGFIVSTDVLDTTRLKLGWTRVEAVDLRGYEIREGLTWESGTPISSLLYDTEKAEYQIAENRTYNFWIKAVDNSYNYSENAANVSITGKVNPDNVTNFQAVQNGEYVALSWAKVANTDLAHYEIRMGMGFETGSLIVSGIKNNFYNVKVDQDKIYYFTVKAVNNAGYYSQSYPVEAINVQNLPPKNVILSYNELELRTGTLENCIFSVSGYLWRDLDKTWDEYETETWDSFGGESVLRLGTDDGKYLLEDESGGYLLEDGSGYYIKEALDEIPSSGSYTSSVKDMGQVITANVTSEFVTSQGTDPDISAILQCRISNDNVTWSAYKDFVPALMTFRYIQFRVVMSTLDDSKTPQVSVLKLYIDVPDTVKSGKETIDVGGETISFGHTYYTLPAVVASSVGAGLRTEISAITETGFTVKVLNAASEDVGGDISWQSVGY